MLGHPDRLRIPESIQDEKLGAEIFHQETGTCEITRQRKSVADLYVPREVDMQAQCGPPVDRE